MAHAEKLSDQVKALTLRVRQLEGALAQAKEEPVAPHIQSATAQDSVHEVSKAIGSLSIGSDGQAKYHGESAGSEYFQELLPLPQEIEQEQNGGHLEAELPTEIVQLMNAFPFGVKDCPYSKSIFEPYFPPRERTLELVNIYFTHVAWMYDPIPRDDLMSSIIDPIYSAIQCADLEVIHSHRLAVFFAVLANGFLFDTHPAAVSIARQYQALGRAAVSFYSLTQEVTCATVQALFLMMRFAYNSDRRTNEERWLLTGFTVRLTQIIGLHRDSEGWNLESEEVQRRRRLFWDLFTWDSWTAVVNGRSPAFLLQYTDCKFPEDTDSTMKADGETELSWHAWKFRYAVTCLAPTVQHIFSTRAPPYAAVLELDKIIRRFGVPAHLRSPYKASDSAKWSLDASTAMKQYCALCLRESNLLYIHRSYFAQAIRQDSENPLRHPYAPSVLATYRSASRLISALKGLYGLHPQMAGQVWFFWSGIYSACIVLGAFVVESPGCTLAGDTILELDLALPFYEEGSKSCRPPNSLAILQKLCQRATVTYNTFKAGLEDTKLRNSGSPDQPDELEVLGGHKAVITHRTQSNPPSLHGDDDITKSPTSIAGAAEMLVEYFEELGNPSFAMYHAQQLESNPPQNQYYTHGASTTPYSLYQGAGQFSTGMGGNQCYHCDGNQQMGQYGPGYSLEEQHNLLNQYANMGVPSSSVSATYNSHFMGQEHEQTQDDIWKGLQWQIG